MHTKFWLASVGAVIVIAGSPAVQARGFGGGIGAMGGLSGAVSGFGGNGAVGGMAGADSSFGHRSFGHQIAADQKSDWTVAPQAALATSAGSRATAGSQADAHSSANGDAGSTHARPTSTGRPGHHPSK